MSFAIGLPSTALPLPSDIQQRIDDSEMNIVSSKPETHK
jgi:hypothetical protein